MTHPLHVPFNQSLRFGDFVEFLTNTEQDQFRNRFDVENDLNTVENAMK